MRTIFAWALGLLAALVSSPAAAQSVDWSGSIYSSVGTSVWKCGLGDGCPLSNYNNRNILELRLDSELASSVIARGEVGLHNVNASSVERVPDSSDINRVQPVRLRAGEVWVEGYDVLVPRFDLRVGNQRIRWGTADGYSPSDRLNPYDLEDPTRFDERLPIPGVLARYHLGDFTFSLTWMPFFVPALLAADVVEIATSEEAAGEVEIDFGADDPPRVRELRTRVVLPPQNLTEMQYAARVQWTASIADFSLGYYWGRDTLPQLSGEIIPESFFSTEEVDIIVNLRYPRMQMIAADARAPLFGGLTGWLDAAFIIPTRTRLYISEERLSDLARLNIIEEPDGDVESVIQSGKPYPTFVAGLDRTFGDLIYLNLQYLYGFIFERNPEDLHHYALLAMRLPSYDAPVEWELRGGAEATPGFDAFGWLASTSVSIRHDDVFKVSLLGLLQSGQPGSTLRLFSLLSEVRLAASAQF